MTHELQAALAHCAREQTEAAQQLFLISLGMQDSIKEEIILRAELLNYEVAKCGQS